MTEDATLDHEGAPGMVAPNEEGQEPATTVAEGASDGAPAAETVEAEPPKKSPRELAMESIDANRMKEFAEETGVSSGDTDPTPPERTLKVKVDGEELELPESEVLKGYQKDQTASRRLEQAAEESKKLQLEWDRLNTEREAFEQSRKSTPAASAAGDDPDDPANSQATPLGDDDGAKQIYEALVSGDEDEAVRAIKKLAQGRPTTEAIPPEKIAAQVRAQIAWEEASDGFSKEYKDILADPLLRQIASNTLTETLKTSKSYGQAFREAGERTRAWVKGASGVMPQAGGDNTQPNPGLAEKQSRKERIDNPTAINARAAGKPQEQAETPSDVIKQMREARGLPA